ncbi:MAG: DUF2867 domain-containing protein, partial [Acidobacteria bacterium]|nr:DUF2867 domain-containing protein [Acidobacteriota bacterium]
PQTLRIYERRGLIEPFRTPGGTRRYSDADLERLSLIQNLTRQGINIEGVKRIIALREENRLLRLCAEMKMPGRAWLQFEVEPVGERSRITQTAVFDPVGLGGLVYWYGLYPIHWLIFRRMLRGVAARAAAM